MTLLWAYREFLLALVVWLCLAVLAYLLVYRVEREESEPLEPGSLVDMGALTGVSTEDLDPESQAILNRNLWRLYDDAPNAPNKEA